jgi:hypothetical protein
MLGSSLLGVIVDPKKRKSNIFINIYAFMLIMTCPCHKLVLAGKDFLDAG